jgi:hypothetical protein
VSSRIAEQPDSGEQRAKPAFDRYIGIDYSGAETPSASLSGLRAYVAHAGSSAVEVRPSNGPRKYWSRRGLAGWLIERLSEDSCTVVGIDHAFSFPVQYFDTHGLSRDWPAFLDDFRHHWPTDEEHVYVDFVRDGSVGNGAARSGHARWRRVTERRARAAKSVFHFDVQGQVAKSTHAGIPWLRHLRRTVGTRVHFWPFDGWAVPTGRSAVVEVYPRLWSGGFDRGDRTPDQHDAYSVAEWMRRADAQGLLTTLLEPPLSAEERSMAAFEGWILGVEGESEMPVSARSHDRGGIGAHGRSGHKPSVPAISKFYGLTIRMFFDEHPPAHFHAEYADARVQISIETLHTLRGSLPARALALVLEWAALHRRELQENWELCRQHRRPKKIDALP